MRILACLALLAACGDDGSSTPTDATILVDGFDNGSCGDQIRLTGEYVDWDTEGGFCGINSAVLQVEGDGAMDSTAPNGRFDLCTPDQTATKLEITQPTANSQCAQPPSMYTTPTIVYARKDVILAGAFYSARSFTEARKASFFTQIGQTFDATKAQVHVRVDGNPKAVTLAASSGAAQMIATGASTWTAGNSGIEVFFPNVDVGSGTTTLTIAGTGVGGGSIPLVAGTITNVAVFVQ